MTDFEIVLFNHNGEIATTEEPISKRMGIYRDEINQPSESLKDKIPIIFKTPFYTVKGVLNTENIFWICSSEGSHERINLAGSTIYGNRPKTYSAQFELSKHVNRIDIAIYADDLEEACKVVKWLQHSFPKNQKEVATVSVGSPFLGYDLVYEGSLFKFYAKKEA